MNVVRTPSKLRFVCWPLVTSPEEGVSPWGHQSKTQTAKLKTSDTDRPSRKRLQTAAKRYVSHTNTMSSVPVTSEDRREVS